MPCRAARIIMLAFMAGGRAAGALPATREESGQRRPLATLPCFTGPYHFLLSIDVVVAGCQKTQRQEDVVRDDNRGGR
jgi:hypothetical protein